MRTAVVVLAAGLLSWGSPVAFAGEVSDDLVREMSEHVRRFEQVLGEYRGDISRVVEFKYQEKRDYVDASFKDTVDKLEAEERKRRLDAISRFEEFLRKYSDHPIYTPDAMFRLAELYFGKSYDQFMQDDMNYETRLADFEAGRLTEPPPEPRKSYDKTIDLFQALIADFPEYRLVDGAYYLLGYCLTEMQEDQRGRDAFITLVRRRPDSQFVPESWMRIGEYYFDFNQLGEAIKAYTAVLEFKESPYYDRAIYKLAWTYYRDDQFDAAIGRFVDLVLFADEQASKEGRSSAGDLREEAIQYIAVSLSEEDWDGDGLPDEISLVDRAFQYIKGDRPFEVEVLHRLGDIFFDNTRYDAALAIYRHLLQHFPYHPDNPAVHMRIVESLERLQRVDDAFAERESLNRSYDRDSDWWKNNEDNKKALKAAEELTEQSLIAAAVYFHDKAQNLKDKAKVMGDDAALAESQRLYQQAAGNYAEYMAKYPHSTNAYELGFFYADCLYYSNRFLEAADQYARVRDEKEDGQYRHEAAKTAIIALEVYIDQLVASGELPPKASPSWDASSAPPEEFEKDENDKPIIPPDELPELVQRLVKERDAYVEAGLTDPEDATLQGKYAFKSAEVFYRAKHLDEARKRFWGVIERYTDEPVGTYAAAFVIDTYRMAGDWEGMAAAAKRTEEMGIKDPGLALEIEAMRLGAAFKKAEEDYAKEKYEDAAAGYVQIVGEKPDYEHADRCLNNAAVAYEKLKKYESAMKLYERIYTEYKDSQFSEYALYRTAINSERFFNFDKATSLYLLLAQRFPKSDKRADALYNAALLQENDQQYEAAAKGYERYVKLFPKRDDVAETYYQAGRVYEKMGDNRQAFRVYNRFIKRWGKDPKNNFRVLQILDKQADEHVAKRRTKQAVKMWKRIIKETAARKIPQGAIEGQFAAKARFNLIEPEFAKYEKIRFKGKLAQQGKLLQTLEKETIPDLNAEYNEVIDYGVFEWMACAYFRSAQTLLLFAEKLYNAPLPKGLEDDPDAADEFQIQMEEYAMPFEEKGIDDLAKIIDAARRRKTTNRCTQETLETLNKYKPQEYPLFKQEKGALQDETLSPLPVLQSSDPGAALAPPPAVAPPPAEGVPPAEGAPPMEDVPPADGMPPAEGLPPAEGGVPPEGGVPEEAGQPPPEAGGVPAEAVPAPEAGGGEAPYEPYGTEAAPAPEAVP